MFPSIESSMHENLRICRVLLLGAPDPLFFSRKAGLCQRWLHSDLATEISTTNRSCGLYYDKTT